MPELPEVENVCRDLTELIPLRAKIKEWRFFRPDLRFKIPKSKLESLKGRPLRGISRRAKYILFDFDDKILISHLGMTGTWRLAAQNWVREKHDHLAFVLEDGKIFLYADPRRFGFVEVIDKGQLGKRFSLLGVEPLDKKTDFLELSRAFLKLSSPIKNALMNQKLVVGVGNIYAAETLFAAGVSPFKSCSKITQKQYQKIWKELIRILNRAVFMGGSTIDNYRNGFGEKGDFQSEFWVYGRAGESCRRCGENIKSKFQAGRNSFWCPNCQK